MKNLLPIEYATQRILTTEQLAEFYECSTAQIEQNFSNNESRFVEGKHYFKIANEALNMLKAKNPCLQISTENSLYLWTKRGCSCHANFLEGFEALDKFEWLEENYFDTEEKQLQIYSNEDFGKIRGVMIDKEPYFVGKDIADALGYKDTSQAIRVNVDDEDKLTRTLYASGQRREMKLINESGLYSLILSSKLPAAKKFKRWVTSEVLPSIRKTGEYSQNNFPKVDSQTKPSEIINEIGVTRDALKNVFGLKDGMALAEATDIAEKFYGRDLSNLKKLIPPADHNVGYMNPTQLAQKCGLKSPQAVNNLLAEKGYQRKEKDGWHLTDEGKKFGEMMPFTRNGHGDYQIKWNDDVLPVIQQFLQISFGKNF